MQVTFTVRHASNIPSFHTLHINILGRFSASLAANKTLGPTEFIDSKIYLYGSRLISVGVLSLSLSLKHTHLIELVKQLNAVEPHVKTIIPPVCISYMCMSNT